MTKVIAEPMELPEGYMLVRCDPAELSPNMIDAVIAVLQAGGAVDVNSARDAIPAATALFLLLYRGELVGLGAIKGGRPWYARRVQERSGHAFDQAMLELGYVSVCPGHTRLHLSGHIVDALLSEYDGALFATTDHERMKSTLGHRGFVQYGVEWDGDRGALSLWLRPLEH